MGLWYFHGPAKEVLGHWSQSRKTGINKILSPMNELFLTLIRMRLGLP